MAQMFSENAQKVLQFLQANKGSLFTADDIAGALGLTPRGVNGTATGLQKKGFTQRIEVAELEKKAIVLTEAGESVDPFAEKPEAE